MPAPRPVRFTAKEITAVLCALNGQTVHSVKDVGTAVRKLMDAGKPAPVGLAVAPMEHALEAAAPGKVARLLSSGYARASKRAAQLGATADDVALIGRWLAPWYRGTVTLLDVFAHWDTWLPKARASVPPRGLPEGLDGRHKANVGQGATPTGVAPAQGRRAPGFR